MRLLITKISEQLLHWIASAIISGVIALGIVQFFFAGHNAGGQNCQNKPCYNELNKRLIAVEASLKAEIAAKTDKRYRADDAERDQRIIRSEIDMLRKELNKRIDKMHEELHKT